MFKFSTGNNSIGVKLKNPISLQAVAYSAIGYYRWRQCSPDKFEMANMYRMRGGSSTLDSM